MPALVVIKGLSLVSELFEQSVNLSVLVLDDMLRTLFHQSAEDASRTFAWLRQVKSSGRDERT